MTPLRCVVQSETFLISPWSECPMGTESSVSDDYIIQSLVAETPLVGVVKFFQDMHAQFCISQQSKGWRVEVGSTVKPFINRPSLATKHNIRNEHTSSLKPFSCAARSIAKTSSVMFMVIMRIKIVIFLKLQIKI